VRTRMLLTIAGLAMVFACLALIGLVGAAAQDVAQRAVTAADTPDTAQRRRPWLLYTTPSPRDRQKSRMTPSDRQKK